LVESALPEGRPSILARRALCGEFLAVARNFHGACVNLNQLTRIAHVRRDIPSGSDEVMAEVRAGGRRIIELAALLSARGGGSPGRRRREARGGGGVIAKLTRGQRPSGAMRYLFGPGSYNEHEDPHVVAASASLRAEAGLRPTKAELERLAAAVDFPAVLFGTEVPGGACWHLSLSTKAGTDRELSDAEWAEVTKEAMRRLGFEGSGHQAGCRSVAVRHGRSSAGNDHVHVVVDLGARGRESGAHGQ
jgi:hypothetical protein